MFETLKNRWKRSRLSDPAFDFLFEPDQSGEVVVFDCETTGLDTAKDEILSIGAVTVRKNRVLGSRRLELFLHPSGSINVDSIKVHQIRHCDLTGAMEPEQGIEQFLRYIGSRPLVGYYLEFDVAMVNRYVKPMLGVTLPNRMVEVSALYYDKKIGAIPQANIDLRFDLIAKDLGIPLLGKHDALNDAVMTAMMYIKLNAIKHI